MQISPAEVVRCLASLVECLPDEIKPHVPESSLCAVLAHDYTESDPLSAVGRAVEAGLDDLVGPDVGICYVAWQLVFYRSFRLKRERVYPVIAVLHYKFIEMYCPAVQPGAGAGFKPSHFKG